MADSLLFNGSSSYLAFSNGSFAANGPWTWAAVVKVTGGSGTYRQWFSEVGTDEGIGLRNTDIQFVYIPAATSNSTFTVGTSDGWVLLAYSDDADNSAPMRHHKYVYSTDTWTHEDGTFTIPGPDGYTGINLGRAGDGSNYWLGNILLVAVWDSDLGDAGVAALETPSLQTWVDAAPDELWRLDSTGTIVPIVGTSTMSANSNTSVDTGDAPSGWVDLGLLDTVLPDADITTTGWSTAPLFSKINDDSDATVITATAS